MEDIIITLFCLYMLIKLWSLLKILVANIKNIYEIFMHNILQENNGSLPTNSNQTQHNITLTVKKEIDTPIINNQQNNDNFYTPIVQNSNIHIGYYD